MSARWFLLGAMLTGCGGATGTDDPTPVEDTRPADDTFVVDSETPDTTEATDSAAPKDSSVDARPPCAVPGALLCEDFESGKIDLDLWKKETTNATLTVDTDRKSGGKYALHARVEGPKVDMPNEAYLHNRSIFPATGNKFFGRAMVFVERNLPDKNFVLIEATGMLADGTGARYGVGGTNTTDGQLFRLVYHPGDYLVKSTSHPPVGRWACWEWSMDGSNDSMRVWIDGNAMPEARAQDEKPAWVAPPFRDLAIGFRVPHPDSHAFYDVWLDDIVLADTRVGCPK